MMIRSARVAAGAALACLAVVAGSAAAWPLGGGIGSAMIYGPYTGGHVYSYNTAYSYNLPFTPNGFSSPWVYPYDWTSIPWNGYVYPGRPLFHKTPCYDDVSAPPDGPQLAAPPLVSAPAPAVVSVHLPADAELWFDGNKADQAGGNRMFRTPALEPGKAYLYAVRARWAQDGKTVEHFQMVTVQAGGQAQVEFSRP